MGNTETYKQKPDDAVFHKPLQGQISEFYWSCRNGDLKAVQNIFSASNFSTINCLEPNGSTGLHAASYFGHFDVVKFLLQQGVLRHEKNLHGFSAYEEAATNEIRELFHRRCNSERFSTSTADHVRSLFSPYDEQLLDENHGAKANEWVLGDNDELSICFNQALLKVLKTMAKRNMLDSSSFTLPDAVDDNKYVVINEEYAVSGLHKLIDKYITPSHSEYKKARELLSKYVQLKNITHLLRLYTLETPFYRNLGSDVDVFYLLFPVFIKSKTLQNRAFQGCSYRGLTMTQNDLRAYKWALKRQGSIPMTKSFCSTSVDKTVATRFIRNVAKDKISVLMVFYFAEICDTAIHLFALSADLPGISDFEDEREVLVLPLTSFHVTNIEIDERTGQHTIHLANLPLKGGFFTLIKTFRKLR
ncbi:hypothetical protein I4U23_005202 [Adineta vaga]|nr:hypothetical protein I4U23_005202 [Adineta vaga]